MRRSAAPSKKNSFNSPTIGSFSVPNTSINATVVNKTVQNNSGKQDSSNLARTTSSILNLIKTDNVKNDHQLLEQNKPSVKSADVNVKNEISDTNKTIYNIVYGKKSTKKHKTWQGDGFLEIINKTLILKDLEGKVLGRISNAKKTTFEDGDILTVGSNEVQIGDLCLNYPPKENFQENKVDSSITEIESTKRKPVENQQSPRLTKKRKVLNTNNVVDYNPLVMPCPPAEHQWIYNRSNKNICEVIVDPQLTRVLRPHQRQGITFLYKCILGFHNRKSDENWMGAILADEMGLGKTLQCITLIWTILKQGPYGGEPLIHRILIVTPSSLMLNWRNEFQKWLGKRIDICVADSKNKLSDFVTSQNVPVLIVSYEMLMRHFDSIQTVKFDLVICDEGHRLKNSTIKATTMLMSLDCQRRILLTGTPIQNDLQEFYSLVSFVNPGFFGTSADYRHYYEEPIRASRNPSADDDIKQLGEERAQELNEKTSCFILRRTQEINNKYLPSKNEIVLFCQMSDLQRTLYEAVIDFWESQRVLSSISIKSNIDHLSVIIALKKICNHPSLIAQTRENETNESVDNNSELIKHLLNILPDSDQMSIDDSGKLIVVDSILKTLSGTKERFIIVSYFTKTLDMLSGYCDYNNYKYCRLDGSTPTSQRNEIVKSFNNPNSDIFVFLLSARAGGMGLNLIGASRLILYDNDWNPATDLQAMARIWRDGQKNKNVYIYRLLTAGTVEEKIFQRQIFKTGLSGAVVDPTNKTKAIKFNEEDLKDLFTLHCNVNCLTHSLLNCNCNCNGTVPEQECVNTDENSDNDVRDCQLGVKTDVASSTLKMNELLLWEHHGLPFNEEILEELALNDADGVVFIFRNKINNNV